MLQPNPMPGYGSMADNKALNRMRAKPLENWSARTLRNDDCNHKRGIAQPTFL